MSNHIAQANTNSGNIVCNNLRTKESLITQGSLIVTGSTVITGGLTINDIYPPNGCLVVHGNISSDGEIQLPYEQIIYVGQNGNNSNNGQHITNAVLTFSNAILKAQELNPSANKRIQIICLDAYTYSDNLTIPQYINISANNATLSGSVALMGYNIVYFRSIIAKTTAVISAGPDVSVNIGNLILDNNIGIENMNSNTLTINIQNVVVGSGVFISVTNPINCTVGNILLNGGTAFSVLSSSITARVNNITESVPSTAISIISGNATAYIENILTTIATNVSGTLNLFATTISGTRLGSGIQNILLPSHANNFNNPHKTTLQQANLADPVIVNKGDLLTINSSGILTNLPVGNDSMILTADSTQPTGLKWTLGGSSPSVSGSTYNLLTGPIQITNNFVWKAACSFQWYNSKFSTYNTGNLVLRTNGPCSIRFQNITTNTTICSIEIPSNTINSYMVVIQKNNFPTSDATLELQVTKTPSIVFPLLVSAIFELIY